MSISSSEAGSTVPGTPGAMANQEQMSAEIAASLQSLLQQILAKTLNSQVVDKNGKPYSSISYMMLENGIPLDPADYQGAWTPAGADTLGDLNQSGQLTTAATSSTATSSAATSTGTASSPAQPQVDVQMEHAISSAANVTALVDTMLAVTTDGSYLASESQFQVSMAYEAVVAKAQGVPAPPPPADVQAAINAARNLLWVFDADGNNTGQQTPLYSQYEQLSATWGGASAAYAAAEAEAATNPAQAAVWPVTSKALQVGVQNAWNDWRSAGADEVENALDTLGSVGGAIGAHMVSEARDLLKTWDLGLTGAVPADTYYSHVLPSSFADPTDTQNGFASLTASQSAWSSSAQSESQSAVSNWFQNHSSGTSGGGGGMIFGITFGATGGSSTTDSSNAQNSQSSTFASFSNQMSNVSISFSYGLCTVYRPWLLTELFAADGWYLPGEPKGQVSTGNLDDQVGAKDQHLLPMIPSQFLVVRDVKISAMNWGTAGDTLSRLRSSAAASAHTDSTSVSGAIGFLSIGGEASHQNANQTGQQSGSQSSYGAWSFSGSSAFGTLTIPGCQIVGWIGQILPLSPKIDSPAASAASGTSSTQSTGTGASDTGSSDTGTSDTGAGGTDGTNSTSADAPSGPTAATISSATPSSNPVAS
jgi:hypothetical protein